MVVSMAPSSSPVTIDLAPTRDQLIDAFVWVALGLVLGAAFAVLGSRGGDVASVGIGLGIVGLAAVSGFLEYRQLPGAVLTVDASQVVVAPRRGDTTVVPTQTIGSLRIAYVPRSRRGAGRRSGRTAGKLPPGWWLVIEPKLDAPPLPGHNRAFAVGVDAARIRELAAACRRFGLALAEP